MFPEKQYQSQVDNKEGAFMSAAVRAGRPAGSKALLRVRCETDDGGRDCQMLDLNSSGAFVECFVPPITGSKVNLRFRLPGGHTVNAGAVVKYHQFKLGFGLEFTTLSSTDRDQIASFLGC
jgi:hypothetical protein